MPVLIVAAFFSSIFYIQTERDLYLLATSLLILGLAAWYGFFTTRQQTCIFEFPRGKAVLLAIVCMSALFLNCLISTVPMISYWVAWSIGLMPLVYLLWLKASTSVHWQRMFVWLCWIGAAVAAWAVIEFVASGGRRANGPFKDYNAFAALLYLLIIPLVGKLALTFDGRSRSRRWLRFSLLALLFLAFFAAASRGGGAVLLVTLPLALVCIRRAGVPVARTTWTVAGFAAGIYLVVKLYPASMHFRTLDLAADASTQARLEMWRSAWHAWQDYPWTGTGLGTYRMHYLHYRSVLEQASSGDLAHNDYVQLLMEGGPLLPALLMVAGASSLWLAWKLWRQAGNVALELGERKRMAAGFSLVVAVLGLFAHASINFIFYVAPLAFLAGLYLAQARVDLMAPSIHKIRIPVGRHILGLAYGLLSLWVVGGLLLDWGIGMAFNADVKWKPVTEMRNDPVRRFKFATAMLAFRPQNVGAHEAATAAAMDLAIAQDDSAIGEAWSGIALNEGKGWLASSRGNPFVYSAIGNLLWHFPDLANRMGPEFANRPDILLNTAIDRYPASASNYRVLAQYYQSQGQETAALVTLWRALPWIKFPVNTQKDLDEWLKLLDDGVRLARKVQDLPLEGNARKAEKEFLSIPAEGGKVMMKRTVPKSED